MSNISRGAMGESMAAELLQKNGYDVLERNYRRMRCELDIIAREGDTLVFVEVKTRRGGRMGLGREAVTPAKQRNIIKAAQCYIMEKQMGDVLARFDVMEIELGSGSITHIKNAFEL